MPNRSNPFPKGGNHPLRGCLGLNPIVFSGSLSLLARLKPTTELCRPLTSKSLSESDDLADGLPGGKTLETLVDLVE